MFVVVIVKIDVEFVGDGVFFYVVDEEIDVLF